MLKDKVQENGEFHKADLINAQSRIEYFDIAKGMGILSIILGHMGVEGVDRIVFTFHVPLFFLISGYFGIRFHYPIITAYTHIGAYYWRKKLYILNMEVILNTNL